MTRTINPERKACVAMAMAAIALLPITGFAKSKPILTTDLLQSLRKGEPWDRSVFTATKAVMFEQAASGGTDATSVAAITLSYFTSADCTGTGQGNDTGSLPNPSYTTPVTAPAGPYPFPISVGKVFGLVAASVWNVGNAKLGISEANMANIQSIAVTFKSTNSNIPQANFSGSSFACVPVTCTAGQCTSGSGTQSFTLKKEAAAVGDPADGGVIACLDGGLNNLVAPASDNSTGIAWGPNETSTVQANSATDGALNTTVIVAAYGAGTSYAAGLCQAYPAAGGYTSGWFLPAGKNSQITQLACLYTNRAAIGGFASAVYWSSAEFSQDRSWVQDFSGGGQGANYKLTPRRVRCVRQLTP